jgi:hypothetical protein
VPKKLATNGAQELICNQVGGCYLFRAVEERERERSFDSMYPSLSAEYPAAKRHFLFIIRSTAPPRGVMSAIIATALNAHYSDTHTPPLCSIPSSPL